MMILKFFVYTPDRRMSHDTSDTTDVENILIIA